VRDFFIFHRELSWASGVHLPRQIPGYAYVIHLQHALCFFADVFIGWYSLNKKQTPTLQYDTVDSLAMPLPRKFSEKVNPQLHVYRALPDMSVQLVKGSSENRISHEW